MLFKKNFNKFLSVSLSIIILICSFSVSNFDASVFAGKGVEESESQRDALEAKGKELRGKLESLKGDISHQEEYRNALESQIEVLRNQISEIDKQIERLGAEILELEGSISELQVHIKEDFGKLKKRLAAIYKAGDIPTVDIVLGSKDFGDFIDKVALAKNISEHDFKLIDGMKAELAELENKQAELTRAKNEIEENKRTLESKQSELESCVEESNRVLGELVEKKSVVLDELDENDVDLRKINDRIANYYAEQARLRAQAQAQVSSEESSSVPSSAPIRSTSGAGDFSWPLKSCFRTITSPFGDTVGRMWKHTGVDVGGGGISGSPIYAARAGKVIDCESGTYGGGYGTYVILDHGDGFATLYAHMSGLCVSVGQTVGEGQQIGAVGSTGHSTGPHLHFEVRVDGEPVNPMQYSYKY